MGLIDLTRTSDNVSNPLLHQRMVGIFDLDIELPAVSGQRLSVRFEQRIHIFASANGTQEILCSLFNHIQIFRYFSFESKWDPAYLCLWINSI